MTISNTAVLATDTTIYTSTNDSAITVIYFCNTSAGTVTLDVHLIPSGGSVLTTTQIYDQLSLVENQTYVIDAEKLVLANGDFISAIGSGTGITATISYVSI